MIERKRRIKRRKDEPGRDMKSIHGLMSTRFIVIIPFALLHLVGVVVDNWNGPNHLVLAAAVRPITIERMSETTTDNNSMPLIDRVGPTLQVYRSVNALISRPSPNASNLLDCGACIVIKSERTLHQWAVILYVDSRTARRLLYSFLLSDFPLLSMHGPLRTLRPAVGSFA